MEDEADLEWARKHITGGIWKTTSVEQTPHIKLTRWIVWELPDGDRHFNGYNLTESEGRVSSKIVSYDPETMIGTTRSGRRYQLSSEPGINMDALYVWSRWCNINKIDKEKAKNVSHEYYEEGNEETRATE